MTPAAKLDSELCSASPTASPAAPMTAISELVWMPAWLSAAMMTMATNRMWALPDRNDTSIGSQPRLAIMRPRPVRSRPANHRPTTRITAAKPMRTPNSIAH